jgi:hypothetical protein
MAGERAGSQICSSKQTPSHRPAAAILFAF